MKGTHVYVEADLSLGIDILIGKELSIVRSYLKYHKLNWNVEKWPLSGTIIANYIIETNGGLRIIFQIVQSVHTIHWKE